MIGIHFAMALFGAIRLTEVIRKDEIFRPFRELFTNPERKFDRWMMTFWNCFKCVSVWAGVAATIAFFYFPWFNWPFAISFLTLLSDRIIAALVTKKPSVSFQFENSGTYVDFGDMDAQLAINRIKAWLTHVEASQKLKQAG